MEEEKAAAYYDELSRKGGGAARFKQGLGFSASGSAASSSVPERGSALPSSSSFLSNFVRASSPTQASKFEKQAQLQSVQNKLKKKPEEKVSRASERSGRESTHRHRSRSRERDRDRERHSRKRSRSRDRDGGRERDRDRRRQRSRSASPRRERRSERSRDRSISPRERRSERSRDRSISPRERRSERSRGRSVSPRERRRTESSGGGERNRERKLAKNRNVDYTRLILGYDKMTPAERVKAKMKLQLAETAEKDEVKGSGWERFEFDKDAPLDDEEIEAAEDDVAIVKRIGQSFRFSAVEARREDQVRDAHDAAMFGVPVRPMSTTTTSDSEPEEQPNRKEEDESGPVTNLISEKVLAKQQGSWRDRARKV